jgi:hypothetical protein
MDGFVPENFGFQRQQLVVALVMGEDCPQIRAKSRHVARKSVKLLHDWDQRYIFEVHHFKNSQASNWEIRFAEWAIPLIARILGEQSYALIILPQRPQFRRPAVQCGAWEYVVQLSLLIIQATIRRRNCCSFRNGSRDGRGKSASQTMALADGSIFGTWKARQRQSMNCQPRFDVRVNGPIHYRRETSDFWQHFLYLGSCEFLGRAIDARVIRFEVRRKPRDFHPWAFV